MNQSTMTIAIGGGLLKVSVVGVPAASAGAATVLLATGGAFFLVLAGAGIYVAYSRSKVMASTLPAGEPVVDSGLSRLWRTDSE